MFLLLVILFLPVMLFIRFISLRIYFVIVIYFSQTCSATRINKYNYFNFAFLSET